LTVLQDLIEVIRKLDSHRQCRSSTVLIVQINKKGWPEGHPIIIKGPVI
jgi:hypothetical protein